MEQPRKPDNIINPTAHDSTLTTPHLTLASSPESPISTPSTSPASSPEKLIVRSITTNNNSISKYSSPAGRSPAKSLSSLSDHLDLTHESPSLEDKTLNSPSPVAVVRSSIHEEPVALTKFDLAGDGGGNFKVEERTGGSGRKFRPGLSILRRTKREKMVKRAALGFRVFGAICCLISFSVMAANKNKGWAIDSFYHYKEFKYSLSVNVIGFMYSAGQAFDSVYNLVSGKNASQHPYRYYFDFAVDQIVTYLLISASSSATTRIDDWQLNWGRDKFPDMATASVAISFLAFIAMTFSSLISGYTLCTSKLLQF